MRISIYFILSIAILVFPFYSMLQTIIEQNKSTLFGFDKTSKLTYSFDAKGNSIPDLPHVGYHSGEKDIPDVPVKITLEPGLGQAALNRPCALYFYTDSARSFSAGTR